MTSEYLAELAWEWHEGQRERVRKMLQAQGKTVDECDGYWRVEWAEHTCGIPTDTTPQDALPMLLMAIIGPYWPMCVGSTYTRAQQIIRRRLAAQRRAAAGESQE